TGGSGGSVGSGGSGGSGGRVGSGGSGGSVGSGGSGGSVGGGISCGNLTCQSNKESCCIQVANGRATETCIPAGASCQGGPSIGCLGGDCGDGRVCCFSLIGLNTTCAAPQQCNNGLSTVLCASDRDCPAARNHCCQTGPIRTCRATACGGGPGGAPTPGPGPGRPGR
ncbi:MAG TPA: hypothetical protein VNO55_24690, partial [Polyangia bacterium]|nr:hypothetical protein [Polyangia bacterium]